MVPEAKRGRVPCDGAEEVCKMHALQMQTRRSQQKAEKATAPSPFQFVIPVSRAQAPRLLNRG